MYVLSIYREDKFIGYIKKIRSFKNLYRFEKTVNLKFAFSSNFIQCNAIKELLEKNLDNFFYYNKSIIFKVTEITPQEVRKSKLFVIRYSIQRTGIFKNKI